MFKVFAFAAISSIHAADASLPGCSQALRGCGFEADQMPLVGSKAREMKMSMLSNCLSKQGLSACADQLIELNDRHVDTLAKKKKKKAGGNKNKAGGKKKKGVGGKKKKGKKKKNGGGSAENVPAGFFKLSGINIPGHNDVTLTGATVTECAQECMSMGPDCLSFDWKDVSETCALSVSVSPKAPYDNGDLYIKIGADDSTAEVGELCGERVGGIECVAGGPECTSGYGDDESWSICVPANNGQGNGNEANSNQGQDNGNAQGPGKRLGELCDADGNEDERCISALLCEAGYGANQEYSMCVTMDPDGYDVFKNTIVIGNDDEIIDQVQTVHMCAFFCLTMGPNCVSFDYHLEDKQCALSKVSEPREEGPGIGTLYVKQNLVSLFGEPCGGPITCADGYTCSDGFGQDGSWYMCAHPVPEGYRVLRNYNIPGENMGDPIYISADGGVEECAFACDENLDCKTFDYKAKTNSQPDSCSLSTATTGFQTYPGDLFFKLSALEENGQN